MFEDITGDGGENISAMYRFGATVSGCDSVAIRSYEEFEPEWLKLLEDLYQKPVIPEDGLKLKLGLTKSKRVSGVYSIW